MSITEIMHDCLNVLIVTFWIVVSLPLVAFIVGLATGIIQL